MPLSLRIAGLLVANFLSVANIVTARAQTSAATAQEKPAIAKPNTEKAILPFQIQLLETRIRFEANSDSRKEVHTIVKINNLLGARQFARLSFDYNRSFQQVEIPLVRVSHANGGTSELLPSAISDAPNPAVANFLAYHDVRVKFARILGLEEGDTIEYRVVTTTTKHPLAPNFWLEHTFDRSGQVLKENYELDLPSRTSAVRIDPTAPPTSKENTGEGDASRTHYQWNIEAPQADATSASASASDRSREHPDIALSKFNWKFLAVKLAEKLTPGAQPIEEAATHEESMAELSRHAKIPEEIRAKAAALTRDCKNDLEKLQAIYDFVRKEVATVDLSLGATGFRIRAPEEILRSAYATQEDKYVLFSSLASAVGLGANPVLTGNCDKSSLATPAPFKHLEILVKSSQKTYWLEPSLDVAPFGMISPAPGNCGFLLERLFLVMDSTGHEWVDIPKGPPFAAFQKVVVTATLAENGNLTSHVKYSVRGENELLLRLAFHQALRDKWKDIAGLLALSDGFRGSVTKVNVSDPTSTKDPFTVEYEITQPKFVDWAKPPVKIPVLLPQIGLPEPPAKSAGTAAGANIQLGTPLHVDTHVILKFPASVAVQTPAGTSVQRDYATFTSKYSVGQGTLNASREIHFMKREIPTERLVDYSAFVHAVQNDQAQSLTLEKKSPTPVKAAPAK